MKNLNSISLDDMEYFYAYINSSTYAEEQDYRPYQECVKLTVINKKTFEKNIFNSEEGCSTMIVEISLFDLFKNEKNRKEILKILKKNITIDVLDYRFSLNEKNNEFDYIKQNDIWIEIKVKVSNKGLPSNKKFNSSYYYNTFSNLQEEPTYFELHSIRKLTNKYEEIKEIKEIKDSSLQIYSNDSPHPEFYSFHVGQGMCSLLKVGNIGIFFDMGAGKPITRKNYSEKSNELTEKYLPNLKEIYIILSHQDSDHWRLMIWEICRCETFFKKIREIIIPSSSKHLFYRNKQIIDKIRAIGKNTELKINKLNINLYRSRPSEINHNNDCIVAIVFINGKKILIPGDYVYNEMIKDYNNNINEIPKDCYNLIIVPHHGDESSANNVPNSVANEVSEAYFSAGTHKGYKHPRQSSINSHKARNFNIISNNTCDVIIKALEIK